jgi:hypothetical protein
MDSGQKPFDTFSQKELDRYFGETADLNAEVSELKTYADQAARIDYVETLVVKILKIMFTRQVLDPDFIVVNTDMRDAAEWCARKYKLNVACHPDFPVGEVWIVRRRDIVDVIMKRVAAKTGAIPTVKIERTRLT